MSEKLNDPRDLMEGTPEKSDNALINHIEEAIERLQEHMEVPTLSAYKLFLEMELEWIKHEKRLRQALARPLP